MYTQCICIHYYILQFKELKQLLIHCLNTIGSQQEIFTTHVFNYFLKYFDHLTYHYQYTHAFFGVV
jgi:hypothetical protein